MSIFFTILLCFLPIVLLLLNMGRSSSQKLPPGSLGIPYIGQSLGLLRAMKANTAEKWLQKRVERYGPISKLSLFGKPTVFIHGQAANKFVFTADGNMISNQQTNSLRMILGDRNLLELMGDDHKRVRAALMSFLKPESLKKYIGKMDNAFRTHLEMYWEGKDQVTVLPLMKTLTFNIICSLLFGLESGARKDEMITMFQHMIEGVWSVPFDMPFTRYRSSLRASQKVQVMIRELIQEKRVELENMGAATPHDLITCFLSIRDDENKELISETEIVQNVMLVMIAGHDTSSILITFILRLLANNTTVYQEVLKEQEEIAKTKSLGEFLTWDDLGKMKYTWRVALETLRMIPPVFGGFRLALKDIEYGGYLIPKGWQIFWASSMTHMDSNIFEEPSKFEPARFENQAQIPPYTYIPFGGGARICPGYEFARIETLVAIHYLVTRFTWTLCCTHDAYSREPMPVPTKSLPIRLFPKKAVHSSL